MASNPYRFPGSLPRPIASLVERAPDPLLLRKLWLWMQHGGPIRDASADTVRRWRVLAFMRALHYMDQSPREAFFVYNTLFTIFELEAQLQLHKHALASYRYALRTESPAA